MASMREFLIAVAVLALLYPIQYYMNYDANSVKRYAPTSDNTAGKRVLVTGSSKGIGRELAELYSELGAHVTVHARSLASLDEVSNKCRQNGAASIHAVVGDMSKIGDAEKVVKEAADAMGGLDIVIVNHISAYTFETLHSAVSRIRSGELQRDLQVDLFSYAEVALAAVPLLEETSGSIVFVSSVAGRYPLPYFYEYSFAKRSLEGLLASVRQELALNGSSVHAGIAILGFADTPSARNFLPRVYARIQYESLRSTAVAIATVAAGRFHQLSWPSEVRLQSRWDALFQTSCETHVRKFVKGRL